MNIKKNYPLFISVINILLTISLFSYIIYEKRYYQESIIEENTILNEKTSIEDAPVTNINVEVKGYVETPGVYKMSSDQVINDLIALAGGFKKDAYTSNINLSKHLADEMLVYVYSKSEFQKLEKSIPPEVTPICQKEVINMCIKEGESIIISGEDTSIVNKNDLININTASKEELMTLSGIGDAKAQSIINYRQEHGNFTKIEEILNVNGISSTIYDKIKIYLTV